MTEAQDQKKHHWDSVAPFWSFRKSHFLSNDQGPDALKFTSVKKVLNPYRAEILESTEKILDIGSGCLPEMYLPKSALSRITALDISKEMLRFNRSKEKVMANANNGLPFNDCSFGFVTMFFVNRYLDNQEQILSEVIRVLKPSGRFIMLDFNTNDHSLEEYLFEPESLSGHPVLVQVKNIGVQVVSPGKQVLDEGVLKVIYKASLFTGEKI